jgi:phosphonopyruvate decarboxylase
MTLTIGWRGALGGSKKVDEPQHLETGKKTEEMLRLLGFTVNSVSNAQEYFDTIQKIHSRVQSREAILVPRGVFDSRALAREVLSPTLTRRQAIDEIYSQLGSSHAFVSGTGYMSRDLSVAHNNMGPVTNSIFYLVGGMGHVSSVAAGIAIGGRVGRVAAIEGDGGALMHLGSIATLTTGQVNTVDLFLIHNGVHASVGGQSIINPNFNFEFFAKSCNFESIQSVKTFVQLRNRLSNLAMAESEQSSTFTLIEVQESANEAPSSRPEGFKEIAKGFKQ